MKRLSTFVALITLANIASASPTAKSDAPAAIPTSSPGPGCTWISATANPIGVSHFQDAKLQQSAGTFSLRAGTAAIRTGTLLATIVGQDADGSLRGNHHFLFADGLLRTKNDRITAKPGADKCTLAITATLDVVEGAGAFANMAGTLTASGTLNICGAPGRVVIDGKVCQAKRP